MKNEPLLLTIDSLANDLGISFSATKENEGTQKLATNTIYYSRKNTHVFAEFKLDLNELNEVYLLKFGPFLLPETNVSFEHLNELITSFKHTIQHLFFLLHRRKETKICEEHLFFEKKNTIEAYVIPEEIGEFYKLELLFFCHIKDNNQKGAHIVLTNMTKYFFQDFSLQELKAYYISMVTLLARVEMEQGQPVHLVFEKQRHYFGFSDSIFDVNSAVDLMWKAILSFFHCFHAYPKNKYSMLVSSMLNYIEEHLHEPITLKKMSAFLGQHEKYLGRKFLKETNYTVKKYVLLKKIQEAKKELLFSNHTLEETAMNLGFASQSHFTQTFKEYTGLTPRKYINSRAFYLY